MEDKENEDNECVRYIRFIKDATDYHPFTGQCRNTTIIDMLCFKTRIIGFGLTEKKNISNIRQVDKIINEMQKEEYEIHEINRKMAYSLSNISNTEDYEEFEFHISLK
jgi:hypothetical protein